MKKGWQTKKLGDLCEIELGKTPARADKAFWDEKRETDNVWLSIADLLNADDNIVVDSKEYLSKTVSKGTLLVSFKLTLGRLAFAGRDLFTNEAIAALTIFNEHELSKEFLFYFLHFFDWRKAAENDIKLKGMTLNKAKLKEMDVHFPPFREQKQIVNVLDEVFEKTAKAKENAEKNLQNARELFESYLHSIFANPGDNWEEKNLGECFKLRSGDNITSKMMNENGKFPVYGGNGIAGRYDKYNLSGSNIVIGRVGALCGNVRHLKEEIWLTDNAFKVTDWKYDFDHAFLTYLLNFKNLRSYARQAAQPVISNSSLESVLLQFPESISEQKNIVSKLDSLSAETKKLEAIYKQKLTDLEELKKSVLHKAFNGELAGACS